MSSEERQLDGTDSGGLEVDEVENYSNWLQTGNGSGELHRNKCGVLLTENDNV